MNTLSATGKNIVMRYIIERKKQNNLDVKSGTRVVIFMPLELVNA